MSKSRILVAALALVFVSAGAAAAQQTSKQAASKPTASKEKKPAMKEQTPGLLSKAKVSADSAEHLARAKEPSAELTKEEIRQDNGKLVYSFYFKDPSKSGRDVIDVDAMAGSVSAARHLSREAAKTERKGTATTSTTKKS